MKLTGLHVAILIGVVVVGLVAYGALHFKGEAPIAQPTAPPEGTMAPANVDATMAPVIEAQPPTQLDMGVISRETPTMQKVTLFNKGKGNLEITSVRTSCGCTAAKIDQDKKIIPPGGQADVEVTVDPAKISGFESRKTLSINSSDPARPRIDIEVLAKIDPEFELTPATIDFGKLEKGQTPEQVMRLRQLMEEPLVLNDLKIATKDIKVSFVKIPEDQWKAPGKAEYDITVRLAEEAPLGSFSGRFALQLNCKRMKSYWCAVKADITSFYKLIPNRPLMLRLNPKSTEPQNSSVTIVGDRPYEIVSIEPSELISATAHPGQGANTQVLEVTLKDVPVPGQRNESVLLTLKSGDKVVKENITVRVYGAAVARPAKANKPPFVIPSSTPAAGAVPPGDQPAPDTVVPQPLQPPAVPGAEAAPAVPAEAAPAVPAPAPDAQPAAAPAQQ